VGGGIHIGTSGWSYADWVGPLYAAGTPAGRYLGEYARHFSAVEIDSTFYRIPGERMVDGWAAATPPRFTFAPKFPQIITHERRLQACDAERDLFLGRLGRLGEKLGPLVLQFDYTFRYEEHHLLEAFLMGLPPGRRIAVEVRHRGWLRDEFYALLERRRAALVLHDLHYMPALNRATADFVYIRLLGKRSLVPDDFSRVRIDRTKELDAWAEKVRSFADRGLEIFVFANNRYQGHAPATCRDLARRLGISLPAPAAPLSLFDAHPPVE
jgi:uncharacterized protein YecE (DUF72 family)